MLLAVLAILSLGLTLWQWWAAWRFALHRREAEGDFCPAISLLKPLKGCDAETERCLRSWFRQDYSGSVQILFGIASPDDPAGELVRNLIEQHPRHDAALLVCRDSLGANAKVSTLVQLHTHAKHEFVVVSDADVWAPSDFLANAVVSLRDPGVGLVNCFYRLANPVNLAMRWEAVAMNADFWSQVLQSQDLKPLDFALGAVMATTRRQLDGIGGFGVLRDYLADDYELGHRIAKRNGRIVLCPVVVECWSAALNWKAVWIHQLRWARTIRVCQPLPYFFSLLSNATLWPVLWLSTQRTAGVLWTVILCLSVRALTAFLNHRKLSPTTARASDFWLAWVKDLLNVAIWVLSFVGSTIQWRGDRYRVRRSGELVKLAP